MRLAWMALCAGIASGASPQPSGSVRFGADDAGARRFVIDHPEAGRLFDEMGFDFLVTHYPPPVPKIDVFMRHFRRTDAWCAENGVEWVYNLESPNFVAKFVDERGRDWFNRDDGRHFFLFPEDILAQIGECRALWGFMYDEAAHMQNCRNKIAGLDAPWIYDPTGDALEGAADGFTQAARAVGEIHARHGIRLSTEHVFPVLYHGFARAGWTAGTKVLKENWSPAYVATAMGAALQYGAELWITPDLWFIGDYPGHSPEELRSALLLAYHMGADRIYIENLCYDHEHAGRGSLVHFTDDDYTVTPWGEVARWFSQEYMPANPRPYSFRDVRPRVAIVRQPDACWGQSDSWLPNMLFGGKEWPSNETTEGWLQVWHLLSRGVIPADTLSWHHSAHRGDPYQVFAPLDGVVVYDHRVGAEHLAGVEVIFLTGLGVSDETLTAIESCVAAGATCVARPGLLPERVRRETGSKGTLAQGEGVWVAAESFPADHVRDAVDSVIPADDVIRYVFGSHEVILRPVDGDPNRLAVSLGQAD